MLSRPRLIKTWNFCGCQDQDSSRLANSVVVETETHRDWDILWLSRPRLIDTGKFHGWQDRDQSRLSKSCQDRDFIESLVDHWGYLRACSCSCYAPFQALMQMKPLTTSLKLNIGPMFMFRILWQGCTCTSTCRMCYRIVILTAFAKTSAAIQGFVIKSLNPHERRLTWSTNLCIALNPTFGAEHQDKD